MSLQAKPRSRSPAIILGTISVLLSITMLVGWILALVLSDLEDQTWLLVLGTISLSLITLALGLFTYWVLRELRASRHQVVFIDSVTHELKTPLASLRLCLDTLDRPQVNLQQAQSLHQMMRADVERLSSFIDDVLVANRIGPRMQHTVRSFPLAELLYRCAERACTHREVDFEAVVVDVPDRLRVQSDPTALETICLNLIDNAIKYSEPPVQVRARARVVGSTVQIAVVDQGIGIDPKDARRIFHRFYRADSPEVRKRNGTGLGLYVVAGLVRSLGGRITARSPGPGQGMTVTVHLPYEPMPQFEGRQTESPEELPPRQLH